MHILRFLWTVKPRIINKSINFLRIGDRSNGDIDRLDSHIQAARQPYL